VSAEHAHLVGDLAVVLGVAAVTSVLARLLEKAMKLVNTGVAEEPETLLEPKPV
jgi:hypothetical protein